MLYPISELARSLCFPVGGASWTLDPGKEAVNFKMKDTNKFAVKEIFPSTTPHQRENDFRNNHQNLFHTVITFRSPDFYC